MIRPVGVVVVRMGGGLEVEDRAGLSALDLAGLRRSIAGHRTLEDVLRWAHGERPAILVEDVVIQDEYSHDVVLPIPAAEPRWLVYSTT